MISIYIYIYMYRPAPPFAVAERRGSGGVDAWRTAMMQGYLYKHV